MQDSTISVVDYIAYLKSKAFYFSSIGKQDEATYWLDEYAKYFNALKYTNKGEVDQLFVPARWMPEEPPKQEVPPESYWDTFDKEREI